MAPLVDDVEQLRISDDDVGNDRLVDDQRAGAAADANASSASFEGNDDDEHSDELSRVLKISIQEGWVGSNLLVGFERACCKDDDNEQKADKRDDEPAVDETTNNDKKSLHFGDDMWEALALQMWPGCFEIFPKQAEAKSYQTLFADDDWFTKLCEYKGGRAALVRFAACTSGYDCNIIGHDNIHQFLEPLELVRGCTGIVMTDHSRPKPLCCALCSALVVAGAVPFLAESIKQADAEGMISALLMIFTNIAANLAHEGTKAIVQCGVVPRIVSLLKTSASPEVREDCCLCLSNIAGTSPHYREIVLNADALEATNLLFEAMKQQPDSASPSLRRTLARTFGIFCGGFSRPDFGTFRPVVPSLAWLLVDPDAPDSSLLYVTRAMHSLSWKDANTHDEQGVKALMDAGITGRLVDMLSSESAEIAKDSLLTLAAFARGNCHQVRILIDAGFLDHVVRLLQHEDKTFSRIICEVLLGVAARGTSETVHLFAGFHDTLIACVYDDDLQVRYLSILLIGCIFHMLVWTDAGPDHETIDLSQSNVQNSLAKVRAGKLVEKGSLSALCSALALDDERFCFSCCKKPSLAICFALLGIEAALDAGEIQKKPGLTSDFASAVDISKIVTLQNYEADDGLISTTATRIVKKYFPDFAWREVMGRRKGGKGRP